MQRQDWILLVLNAAEDDTLSPVQLQKTLFLIRKNFPRATGRRFYRFMPYNYGPFSASIYSDAEELAGAGLVEISYPKKGSYARYSITRAGTVEAENLKARLKVKPRKYVNDVVRWAESLSFTQLVRSIYDAYPEQRVNSVFRH